MHAKKATSIEARIADENWLAARRAIRHALRRAPDDHWLLDRLALTYYESYDYTTALRHSRRAVALAPRCPLALCCLAGSLDMLRREKEAIMIWKGLLRRGVGRLGRQIPCGEGEKWAAQLLNDIRYRLACSYCDLGNLAVAARYFRRHLAIRKAPGSEFAMRDIRKTKTGKLLLRTQTAHKRPRRDDSQG